MAKETATPRNPAKSSTGFRPLVPVAQGSSEFFTADQMGFKFKKVYDDWTLYRRSDCKEVDLHFGERDRDRHNYYYEAMAEVEDIVEGELIAAQKDGRTYSTAVQHPGRVRQRLDQWFAILCNHRKRHR